MWFGTAGGVSRYDGEVFINFTTEDGLVSNNVWAIHQDPAGEMWFGTSDGVSRGVYLRSARVLSPEERRDGEASAPKRFVRFTTEDRLGSGVVWAIHQDSKGVMWFATQSGASAYDGTAWTSLDTRDGLVGDEIYSIDQDEDGFLWFGTAGGITRYRQDTIPPRICIDSVYTAPDQPYMELEAIPPITAGTRVTIEYYAIDFKTLPTKRQYRYWIKEIDNDWRSPTGKPLFEWVPPKPRMYAFTARPYTFEVQAIDRDLNYSDPASVTLTIIPPWYLNGWIALPAESMIVAIMITSIIYGSRYYAKRREAQQLQHRMHEQEQRAREELEAKNVELHTSYEALRRTHQELLATKQEIGYRLDAAITELQEMQQQIAQQERLRALGQMTSGIAHDFNNSLTPILGFSEWLLNFPGALGNEEDLKSTLQMINTAAQGAANVIRRLRDFYRQRGDDEIFESVNLNQAADEAIALAQPKWRDQALAAGITIHIEKDLDREIPPISGNETELREALTNLIFNAVDAIAKVGTITIRTYCDGTDVVLEVSDTGAGMTEEIRQRCLEPFFSTKEERGTGLGLSTVFGIIERHQGEIAVESRLGVGTTFIIRLPSVEGNQIASGSQEEEPLSPSQRVLVVDDDPAVLQLISTYLTTDGHFFETATDGQRGLEGFRAGRFDLVVVDKAMPGMNGDELAIAIKQLAPHMPVIMLTGFGDSMQVSGEQPAGVDVIVNKPVTLGQFRDALENVRSS